MDLILDTHPEEYSRQAFQIGLYNDDNDVHLK